MTLIISHLKDRYLDGELEKLLGGSNISILKDFLQNWGAVEQFYERYYANGLPKIVLCGINPGRLGAGKTGVPFIDFKSLSCLLTGINRAETERSAQFFFRVIERLGVEIFYDSFYVTNLSWVGYTKNSRNVNFDALPNLAYEKILSIFREEMDLVQPKMIISLSGSVHEVVSRTFGSNVNCNLTLPHPNYCSFPSRHNHYLDEYVSVLTPFLRAPP